MKLQEAPEIARYHRVSMRIPFRDVDSWGLVWHGHYFSYVDAARIELLRNFGVHLAEFPKHGFLMPLVSLNMDLRAPGRADEPMLIDVAVLRVRGAMADTHFRITLDDGTDSKVLARGSTRQVFTRPDGGLLYHIPDAVEAGFDAMTEHALGQTP